MLNYIIYLTDHSQHVTDTSISLLLMQDEGLERSNQHWRITRYAEVEQFTPLSTVELKSMPNLYSVQISSQEAICISYCTHMRAITDIVS